MNIILECEYGSQAYGLATKDSDSDLLAVNVESPKYVTGLQESKTKRETTAGDGNRSQAGDTDRTIHPLRKWASLCAGGNPTILTTLFVPHYTVSTDHSLNFILHRDAFISKKAGYAHLGYMNSQLKALQGERHKNVARPELEEKYGYDCYHEETEFLTEEGWKLYDDIEDGVSLATVNQGTNEVEFQVPFERLKKSYSGDMLTHKSHYTGWCVTPNHRMYVSKMNRGASGVNSREYSEDTASPWGFVRADEMLRGDWYTLAAGQERVEEYPVTDAYLNLMGAYISEGTTSKRLKNGDASVLAFEQKIGNRLFSIMDQVSTEFTLMEYSYPARRDTVIWTLANREVAKKLTEECGQGSRNKKLPTWVLNLSSRQSDVLVNAMIAGDGTVHKSGGFVYYTSSVQLANDLQALTITSGRRTSVRGPYDTAQMYQVLIKDREDGKTMSIRGRDFKTEHVETNIVCFSVPNETLVTRFKGKVAMIGNTKFAYHAVRLGVQGIQLMEHGMYTLPFDGEDRKLFMDIRNGELGKQEVVYLIEDYAKQLKKSIDNTKLPDNADYERINTLLHKVYQTEWDRYDYRNQ